MPDSTQLFARLTDQQSRIQRHAWWIDLVAFLRGDGLLPQDSAQRTVILLDTLDARPDIKEKLQSSWQALCLELDWTLLLADFGFSSRTAFVSALASRLRNQWLPKTPDTDDSATLFELAFSHANDGQWIAAMDATAIDRIALLLQLPVTKALLSEWQSDLLDAIEISISQVTANGFSSELRSRMAPEMLAARPFHWLTKDFQVLRAAIESRCESDESKSEAAAALRERLEACRQAVASTYAHLEENGISLGLVFQVRQVRERIVRIRELMDCLVSEKPLLSTQKLFSRLAVLSQSLNSVRSLVKSNSALLATKVTQRSAQTGEAYITRTKAEFFQMLRRACGGGAIVSITTVMKFALLGIASSAFWSGLLASTNYAVSFIVIYLLHWTLATKQPAMTAPAMAARLKDVGEDSLIASFVDEVTQLVRSQTAAVIGNLLLVVPCVLGGAFVFRSVWGADLIDSAKANAIFNDLSPLGWTFIYAAFTGVLLFVSSIIAGWAENWFVLHCLDSAIQYNPRIIRLLGSSRSERWAIFWRDHIAGFAASISLGLLLGLVPAFANFFGLGLEVRHVTLSAGQVALAASVLGSAVLQQTNFWLAVAAVPIIGLLNVVVSFVFALRLALTATAISGGDRKRLRSAIFARMRSAPLTFFWPKLAT